MVSVDSEEITLLIHRPDRNSVNIYEDDDLKAVTTAKLKKTWIYTSTPPYVFMA
jgi:hypothetical protein